MSTLLLRDSRPRVRGLAAYIRSGYSATITKDNVFNCHKVQLVRVCNRLNKFYDFSLNCNPDLDDTLYDCLLSSMSDIKQVDRKAVFSFAGDLNAHHQEWLGSISGTDCHGVAANDVSNLSGCNHLIDGPTHRLSNCLDLLVTDAPGVVDCVVDALLGNSNHSCISTILFFYPKYYVFAQGLHKILC